MLSAAVKPPRRTYPGTGKAVLLGDLELMLRSIVAIARGQEPPAEVGALSLGEYAGRMSAPHRMDLMISAMTREGRWHCNQKCLHCYAAGQSLADAPELSTQQWLDILRRLREANIPQVTFTGGEPTLRADLPELVDASYAKTLIMLVIPVIMIILMLKGWNLIGTLIVCDLVGFVLCLVFGFIEPAKMVDAAGPIGAGLTGMLNVICFSFFMFALLEMLTRSGVFDIMLGKLHNASKTPRQAELVTILICFVGSVRR